MNGLGSDSKIGGSVPLRSVNDYYTDVPVLSGQWPGPAVLLRDQARGRGSVEGETQPLSFGPLKT